MSRTQKLYERLDNAEAHYLSLLRVELEASLRGELAHYLGRKLREHWRRVICASPDERASELQSLEKEIRGLRLKLGEPVPGAAVGVAESLVKRIKDSKNWSPGTNKAWIRDAIAEFVQQGQTAQATKGES
jgi:hypothetical protein